MISVSSVSGGKTSAYMAVHYPTDYYTFAVVLINHPRSAPADKGLLREAKSRIPWFVASAEADLTLLNILKLEQKLGKEIKWVANEFTFDDFIESSTDLPHYRSGKTLLPNSRTRFCTQNLKIYPIFWHCYLNHFQATDPSPILMNIGFRFDEQKRVAQWNCDKDAMRFPVSCSISGQKRYRWQEIRDWRISQFPLFAEKIKEEDILRYWNKEGWEFPLVSNCRFCFFHSDQEIAHQVHLEPENLEWWIEQEERAGKSFGNRPLLERINNPSYKPKQSSCFCTD